jgi:hypothetical protein
MAQEQVPAAEPLKPAGYEFTAAQNATIEGLAKRMKFIGIIYLVFGGLVAIGALWMLTQSLPSALVAILEVALFGFMGYWTVKAAGSFQMIVQTRGNDISFLMNALEELRKIYNLQVWLFIIVLGLLAIGIVVMVVLML